MPHFHNKNLLEFHVWCAMAHRQSFMLVYTTCANVSMLGQSGAPQSIKHIDQDSHSVWLCTLYDMNMHLQQMPRAHTYATRLRALMPRESHSRSHESPSYKVHDHPYTHRHIYIHTHTYIMHNAITQSRKIKQTLPTFQGYGLARYRKCKTYIDIPMEHSPSKEQEKIKGTRRGGTLIHALEKRLGEREEEKALKGG